MVTVEGLLALADHLEAATATNAPYCNNVALIRLPVIVTIAYSRTAAIHVLL